MSPPRPQAPSKPRTKARGEDNEEQEPGGDCDYPALKELEREEAHKVGGENTGRRHERNKARQGAERWQGCEALACPCHKTELLGLR